MKQKRKSTSKKPASPRRSSSGKRAPTTQGKEKSEEKAAAQGQEQRDAGSVTERPIGLSPAHAVPYEPDSTNVQHARSSDAISAFRRAAMNHAEALYKFEKADLSDYSAITRTSDDLAHARYNLIETRERVLRLCRTNG